ncbi:GntR family transcriptional regulator [Bosea sp. BE125]|uniref:GntR family transcriptional regulator n=1 Tax=Bosea sp. BE125 TaxID=2817909 RepID=UPI002866DCC8|nr:GntR family transcriptional regulator [Bosea sp. BE125]MDR6869250.1 GntR family transcriptional regulator [Bosea sp. BE125]
MLRITKGQLIEVSPTPLYLQLAELIRAQVRDGAIKTGDALPSERELSDAIGISRVTVRKSLDVLLREGLLSRKHGSGTYIAPRIEQPAALLAGFSADMAIRGHAAGSIWVEKATGLPTPDEAMALALSLDQPVHRLTRVRTADDEPLAIERAVVPARHLPSLDEVGISLYAALEARGAKPVRGLQRLQASLATAPEAKLLSVPVGAAILRIERRGFLPNGTPVEFTRSAYRGDRYDFVVEVRELRSEGGKVDSGKVESGKVESGT